MQADAPFPPRGPLAALALAMLLPSLGTSIANVALPSLAASFGASSRDVQWVVIAYLLAITTLVVAAGRLGDAFGRRRLLLIGIGTFAAASAVGALAPSLGMLIAARAVQGAGAAVMMALSVAAVGDMVPKERSGTVMGLLGTVSAVGTALGPSLGGALTAAVGWSAVFAAMALAGVAALLLGLRMFPADPPIERRRPSLDVAGMLVLALALGLYALSTTLDAAPWVNGTLAILAVVGLVAFVAIESRADAPLIKLELLRDGELSAGLISMALVSAILMATLVVGPFYLAQGLGLGAAGTGLVMSVGPGVAALVGVPAGRLVDRVGTAAAAIAGLGGVGSGCILMTVLPGAFGVGGYVASLALLTAGYALFQAANTSALMKGAAADRRGVTSALLALARNLGLVTGASVMGAVFALGSRGVEGLGLSAGGEAGVRLTFAVGAALAGLALAATWWGLPRRLPAG